MSEKASLTKTSETKEKSPSTKSPSTKPKENLYQSMDPPVEEILHLQQTIGNQAVQRLIKSGTIQAKLKIGQPNDKYEMEADRVAEKVMTMPEPKQSSVNSHWSLGKQVTPLIQKQEQPEEEEERNQEEEEEQIQTKPITDQITPLVQRQVDTEEEKERIQTKPITESITPIIQRQVDNSGGTEPKTGTDPGKTAAQGLIVEDSTTELAPGQMKKSQFLAQLQAAVYSTVESALEGTGHTTEDCPYIKYWFMFYKFKNSQYIERAVHKYAPETSGAASARDYIYIITIRVRNAAVIWAKTGKITGVPKDIPTGMRGTGLIGGLVSKIGGIFFKARAGGAKNVDNLQTIQARLGTGRPLDSGVSSGIGSAFGQDFSHVRIHTDAQAAQLSDDLNARAFTIGKDVAFAPGEYRPGTLIGDALIAHELAHVVQQGGGSPSNTPMKKGEEENNALENDADMFAVNAVASSWNGTKGGVSNFAKKGISNIKTGLRLQRCKNKKKAEDVKDLSVTGKKYDSEDYRNIYFDKEKADLEGDEKEKIASRLTTPTTEEEKEKYVGNSSYLTLHGYTSEEEFFDDNSKRTNLVNKRINNVANELTNNKDNKYKGEIKRKHHTASESRGQINYRDWRKVEILKPKPKTTSEPGTEDEPSGCLGKSPFIPCSRNATAVKTEALNILEDTIQALSMMDERVEKPLEKLSLGTDPKAVKKIIKNLYKIKKFISSAPILGQDKFIVPDYKEEKILSKVKSESPSIRCSSECNTDCTNKAAYEEGTKVTLCEMETGTPEDNAYTLIHEAAHAAFGAEDLAYTGQRLMISLESDDALNNAEHYENLAYMIHTGEDIDLGIRDIEGSGFPQDGSYGVENVFRALAYMEEWLVDAYQTVQNVYTAAVDSIEAGEWENIRYLIYQSIISIYFKGVKDPYPGGDTRKKPNPATDKDTHNLAAIYDKYLHMSNYMEEEPLVVNFNLQKKEWKLSDREITVNHRFFALGNVERVKYLFKLLLKQNNLEPYPFVRVADTFRKENDTGP